jgi:hypothetical protein
MQNMVSDSLLNATVARIVQAIQLFVTTCLCSSKL